VIKLVSKEILISKDLDSVYRFIEKTLCTAFEVKKDNLLGAENTYKLNRGNGMASMSGKLFPKLKSTKFFLLNLIGALTR